MFIFSLLMRPWLLSKIQVDYFKHRQPESSWLMLVSPHNLLRNLPLLAGVLMLVLPGQGLLTIFVGLAIMQFPGKYDL